jgi:hypothetical protein
MQHAGLDLLFRDAVADLAGLGDVEQRERTWWLLTLIAPSRT